MEALPDRILIRPIPVRHGLVHDRHAWRVFAVGWRERAASQNRHLDGLEVTRVHIVGEDHRRLTVRIGRASFRMHNLAVLVVTHGDAKSQTDGLNSSYRVHAAFELAIEIFGALLVVTCPFRIQSDVQEVIRIETEIQRLSILKAAPKQASRDQQHERTRHLAHHEQAAYALTACAAGSAAAIM